MNSANSIVSPLSPKNKNEWVFLGRVSPETTLGYEGYGWRHPERNIQVISAVEVAHDPGDIDKGPEYHVSISRFTDSGQVFRADRNDTRYVIRQFGIEDGDEDNHVPSGMVRNFWMPVNENLRGHICPCKGSEPAIVEDKGDFVWRAIPGSKGL